VQQASTIRPETYAALAAEFGTPLFVYDAAVLTSSLCALRSALHPDMEIFYSLKANPNISIVALLASHGARAEVSSLVELRTAVLAGVSPQDIIFLGPGKSHHELHACVAAGIYAVVVESFDELADLNRIAAGQGVRQRALLRVNPAPWSDAIGGGLTMGGKPRQFGIDEDQVLAAGPLVDRHPAVDLAGVHVYLGTRILDANAVVENTARNLDLAERVADATGIRLDAVDVGGGLGVAYFDGENDPDLAELAAGLAGVVDKFRARYPDTRLLFEAGRYLAALAGVYVVRVRYVKESLGQRFAVADGGTHHHMAAVGIGSYVHRNFPIRLLNRPAGKADESWHVTGPLCTPNDTIGKNVALPPLRPGDLLGVERSGAYGATASPGLFLSHGFPAEVLVHAGAPYLIRNRDEPADLLRMQQHHTFRSTPMNRVQAVEQIRTVISQLLGRDVAALSENTKLAELGLDSTGVLEMLIELEKHASFEVDADALDAEVFATVGGLTDYVMHMTAVR
jgi:diaminopimelate decarboxylase